MTFKLDKSTAASLGVGLFALLLGIFQSQLNSGILHIPSVYMPYIAGLVGFTLTVGIPAVYHRTPEAPVSPTVSTSDPVVLPIGTDTPPVA